MCDSGICAGCRADQRRKKHGDYAGVVDIARNGIDRVNNLEKEVERLRARVAELEASASEVFTAMLVEIDGHTYGLRPGAARMVKDALRDAGRYRLIRDGDGWPAAFGSAKDPEPLRDFLLDEAIRIAEKHAAMANGGAP